MLGGIQTARPNVPLLALGIKADLDGLLPASAREGRTTAAATW